MSRARNDYRRTDGEFYYPGGYDNTGLLTQRAAEEEAEHGSAQLLEAHQALFRNWERLHGFVEGAGKILLPAGWAAE